MSTIFKSSSARSSAFILLALALATAVNALHATKSPKELDLCLESCPSEESKVCGHDAQTYENECTAQCHSAFVVHTGPCVKHTGSGRVLQSSYQCSASCSGSFQPVCVSGTWTFFNWCLAQCFNVAPANSVVGACKPMNNFRFCHAKCDSTQAPVCGSDGKTYDNLCKLTCESTAELNKTGPCTPPKPDCICPANVDPVCGANGKNFGNECLAACENVEVVHKGNCRPEDCLCPPGGEKVCGSNGWTYLNECTATKCGGVKVSSKGACKTPGQPGRYCFAPCDKNWDPYCGLDGVTYANGCQATCGNPSDIAYKGVCYLKQSCICTMIYMPVCGANNQTYGSACSAACASVPVLYEGECKATQPPAPCVCPRNYDPVCGVNGKNYSNPCLANCEKAEIAYKGTCKVTPPPPPPVGPCDKPCSTAWSPACGKDGLTYRSQCQLECTYGGQLASKGACKTDPTCSCGTRYSPQCGVDNRNYMNPCRAKCAKIKVQYAGNCLDCRKKCSTLYQPVCGVDGFTRKNLCELVCTDKVGFHSPGECPSKSQLCRCGASNEKVCGVNGKIYDSACLASCDAMKTQPMRACQQSNNANNWFPFPRR